MRIRTIKPEFFKHEELFEAERESGLPLRIAYAGLWCAADREGRFKWQARRLGVEILPYDGVLFADVLVALETRGFVKKYKVGDADYGLLPTFKDHQCINIREAQSSLPAPDEPIKDVNARARTRDAQDREGENIPKALRQAVYARDGHKCCRCPNVDDLTVDHIFPRSVGGTHAITNLRTMCRACNSARPVAGEGLIQDLARDGLSMVDIERMCLHVNAHEKQVRTPGERKGKEGNMERKGKDSSTNHATLELPLDDEKAGRHTYITDNIGALYTGITHDPFPFTKRFAARLKVFLEGWPGTGPEFLEKYAEVLRNRASQFLPGLREAADPVHFCDNYPSVCADLESLKSNGNHRPTHRPAPVVTRNTEVPTGTTRQSLNATAAGGLPGMQRPDPLEHEAGGGDDA